MHRSYKAHITSRKRGIRRVLISGAILVLLVGAATIVIRHVYYEDLRPVSTSTKVQLVTIQTGSSTNDIASMLYKNGLIRNAQIFEWYVRSENQDALQAGTYALKPNMSVQQIVTALAGGRIATNLVTILPGQRLTEIRTALINDGFSANAVDTALQPSTYPNAPILAYKPASASLEGLLYPDSFEKDTNTNPQLIINESLTEMYQHLTPDIRDAFAKEGLSVYQGITLASIVENEVSNQSDRAQAAQVFLSRLKDNMPLGSDSTAIYGALLAGKTQTTTYDSPYDTLIHKGLPPGPISNVSESSLEAVAHPANTDWLYFVSGDDGTTYFSKTVQEHDAQTAEYCHKLCAEEEQ